MENLLEEETVALSKRVVKMHSGTKPISYQEGSAKRSESTSVAQADCPVLCLVVSKEWPKSGWHTWDSICFQKPDERMQPMCESSLSSSRKVETFVTDHTQIFERISVGKAVTIIQQLEKTISSGIEAGDLRPFCIDSQASFNACLEAWPTTRWIRISLVAASCAS
eukprot:33398-Pelagomonas_calceolata.AAC.1